MNAYLPEFIVFATAHILSLISPGPDFAMVVRNSTRYSRKTAILTALGIACGEMIHVSYSIFGLGVLIKESPFYLTALKYLGGAYLVYVGIQSLRAKRESFEAVKSSHGAINGDLTPAQAFRSGVLTNALNAKAAFFTISFFAVLVSPETPVWIQWSYGFFIWFSTLAWFSIVATFLTHEPIQASMFGIKHWIERATGAVLVALGIRLAMFDLANLV